MHKTLKNIFVRTYNLISLQIYGIMLEVDKIRIIAGVHRGRPLAAPTNDKIRPTADRVKCAVFSMINHKIYGANVLDLFCGSGALGLETLSRGAKYCTFVDKNREAATLTAQNIERLNFCKNATVINQSAENFVAENNSKFNIIMLDPPYFDDDAYKILQNLTPILDLNAIVVAEHAKLIDLPDEIGDLYRIKHKIYGTVSVSIYEFAGG